MVRCKADRNKHCRLTRQRCTECGIFFKPQMPRPDPSRKIQLRSLTDNLLDVAIIIDDSHREFLPWSCFAVQPVQNCFQDIIHILAAIEMVKISNSHRAGRQDQATEPRSCAHTPAINVTSPISVGGCAVTVDRCRRTRNVELYRKGQMQMRSHCLVSHELRALTNGGNVVGIGRACGNRPQTPTRPYIGKSADDLVCVDTGERTSRLVRDYHRP